MSTKVCGPQGPVKVTDMNLAAVDDGKTVEVERSELPKADRELLVKSSTVTYRLIRMIEEGGLGTVWLARDESLNRNVALKQLKPHRLKKKMTQRFRREAEITGQLEHPNIVSLHFFGNDEATGEAFYAMPYVGRRTLADAIEEYYDRIDAGENAALGLHRLLTIFVDICHAIAYAHSRGVIHRDLKPDNIALDDFGRVTVLDWGIAKLVEDGELSFQSTVDSSLKDSQLMRTNEGQVMGSLHYMAPEQATGDIHHIDNLTDIYGLGGILFSILTGHAPHRVQPGSGVPDPLSEVLYNIANRDTPRVRDHNPAAPGKLDSICAKAMSKKSHLRYDSAEDFAHEIEKWMAGKSESQSRRQALLAKGRELRSGLRAALVELQRDVIFISKMPPIRFLSNDLAAEEKEQWSEHLGEIYGELLEANPNYRRAMFARLTDDGFREFVRVQRRGGINCRVSRTPEIFLQSNVSDSVSAGAALSEPDQVVLGLVDPGLSHRLEGPITPFLSGAAPIYDPAMHSLAGMVRIDSDLAAILRQEACHQSPDSEIVLCDAGGVVLLHLIGPTIVSESRGKSANQLDKRFRSVIEQLDRSEEILVPEDLNLYAAAVSLNHEQQQIRFILR
ncbi:serine/threonine protein kinase [Roseiconus lacunae]|uniref:serine/threonine protein kinase n=1 Tax=Roseiconus lacunae TaxID=2605694 RepID=UPI001E2D3F97|nr:serine/threonine-protein kinase [Roseiconus lacunae]MCD0457847.1 serine/threonine protein kinase [Roseiconus lacunae]